MYEKVVADEFSTFGYNVISKNFKTATTPPKNLNFFKINSRNYTGNQTTIIKKDLIKGITQFKIPHEDYIFWYLIIWKRKKYPKTYQKIIVDKYVTKNSLDGNKFISIYYRLHSGLFLVRKTGSLKVFIFQFFGFIYYLISQFKRLIFAYAK